MRAWPDSRPGAPCQAPAIALAELEDALSLLEVKDLRVSFPTADGVVRAVRGVSFGVDSGRTLGIVGESGSGKTVLTQTLLGLAPGGEVSGQALFNGTDLLALGPAELRKVRGAQIAGVRK